MCVDFGGEREVALGGWTTHSVAAGERGELQVQLGNGVDPPLARI